MHLLGLSARPVPLAAAVSGSVFRADQMSAATSCEVFRNEAGFFSQHNFNRGSSNDLTQLVLGIDRDSGTVSHLFDENDRAVLSLIAQVIDEARRAGKPIGICGQAPSDFPEFARWLVEQGVTSISLNPDVAINTHLIIADEEKRLGIGPPFETELPLMESSRAAA